MSRTIPTRSQRAYHSALMMTERQVKRLRSGQLESTPAEYGDGNRTAITGADRAAARARSTIEDRRMLRELGLDDGALHAA